MEKFLDMILKSVLSYFSLWLQAKKAERLETKVKQLESKAATKKIERELAKKLDSDLNGKPVSPAEWNKGAGTLPLVFLSITLVFAGCTKFVESRWPVLPTPPRPVVPATPVEWTERENILARYGSALEAMIKDYNARAKAHNTEHGYDN